MFLRTKLITVLRTHQNNVAFATEPSFLGANPHPTNLNALHHLEIKFFFISAAMSRYQESALSGEHLMGYQEPFGSTQTFLMGNQITATTSKKPASLRE